MSTYRRRDPTAAGTGGGGLPTEVIGDGVINEGKLSSGVQAKLNQGGPAGPTGPTGPPGPQGPAGVAGCELVTVESASNSSALKDATATCPSGKRLLGGGTLLTGVISDVLVAYQGPIGLGYTARAVEVATNNFNWGVRATAICAQV